MKPQQPFFIGLPTFSAPSIHVRSEKACTHYSYHQWNSFSPPRTGRNKCTVGTGRTMQTVQTVQMVTNRSSEEPIDESMRNRVVDNHFDNHEDVQPGPSLDADEATVIAHNELIFADLIKDDLLKDTVRVTVSLPMGLIVEELPTGELFIDEILEGGNAEKTGLLQEGDGLVAVSLPFGDGLVPLAGEEAMDDFAERVESRREDFINLAVRRGNIDELRRIVSEAAEEEEVNTEELLELINNIHADWYPLVPDDDDEEDGDEPRLDIEAMKSAGFDMDGDVSYTPTAEELADAPDEDADADHWRELYEKGMAQRFGTDSPMTDPSDGNGNCFGTDNGNDIWK